MPRLDFSLPDAKGKTHSLSDYKGKYVVSGVVQSGMPFCEKALRRRQHAEFAREFTDKGVVWLSVDSSAPGKEGNLPPEQAEKMMTEWKTNSTALLLDRDGKAGRTYTARKHAAHVCYQSRRQNNLRRRDRQQSLAESG